MPVLRFLLLHSLRAAVALTALLWLVITTLWAHSLLTRTDLPEQLIHSPYPRGDIHLQAGHLTVYANHNPTYTAPASTISVEWYSQRGPNPPAVRASWSPAGTPEETYGRCASGEIYNNLFNLGDSFDARLSIARTDHEYNNTTFFYSATLSFRYFYAIIALPFLFLAPLTTRLLLRRLHPQIPGTCPACGYDLRATPHRCPECGQIPLPPLPPDQQPTTNY